MNKNSHIELENLEIYKQIVEHMAESLWIGDLDNNTIYVNDIFCELSGYSGEEVIGENYRVFMGEESVKKIQKRLKDKKTIKYETYLKTKFGDNIPILCSGTFTQNGGIVLTISDLSELKSLKKAERDLIEINKTKDEFISIVGHELRTPLTSIRGYLSMILDGDMGEVSPLIEKALSHSYDSSVRLIKLVNDVLSIGKIESGKMEYYMSDVNLTDLLYSTFKDIHLEIEQKHIKFYLDIDKTLKDKYIHTDKDKLKQVFLNLLTNSLKFTEKGGKITLKASNLKNKKARFEVIDTGVGIPKDKIKDLFNKFSQVESSMQRQNDSGLGLGLAICKNFVNEFGSQIKVESEVGKGSKFYFDLDINK